MLGLTQPLTSTAHPGLCRSTPAQADFFFTSIIILLSSQHRLNLLFSNEVILDVLQFSNVKCIHTVEQQISRTSFYKTDTLYTSNGNSPCPHHHSYSVPVKLSHRGGSYSFCV